MGSVKTYGSLSLTAFSAIFVMQSLQIASSRPMHPQSNVYFSLPPESIPDGDSTKIEQKLLLIAFVENYVDHANKISALNEIESYSAKEKTAGYKLGAAFNEEHRRDRGLGFENQPRQIVSRDTQNELDWSPDLKAAVKTHIEVRPVAECNLTDSTSTTTNSEAVYNLTQLYCERPFPYIEKSDFYGLTISRCETQTCKDSKTTINKVLYCEQLKTKKPLCLKNKETSVWLGYNMMLPDGCKCKLVAEK